MAEIPWSSGGWKGLQVARNALPGFEAPGFDDSAWPAVTLPIGNGGTCPLPVSNPPATSWAANTDFLLRRTVVGNAFRLRFAIDNDARIFFDGVSVGFFSNEDCPTRNDFAPHSGSLPSAGAHVLAIRCTDRGFTSYFDCELELSSTGFLVGAGAFA